MGGRILVGLAIRVKPGRRVSRTARPDPSDLASSLQFQDYRLNGPTGRGKLNSPPSPSPFQDGVVDAAGGHCIADEPDVIHLTL